MKIRYLFIIIFCCLNSFVATSQQVERATVVKELEKQGVSEEEVTKRLLERGLDPNNVDLNNPSELIEMQAATEAIVKEIKAEKEQLSRAVILDTLPQSDILTEDLGNVEDVLNEEVQQLEVDDQITEGVEKLKIYGHHLFENKSVNFYSKTQYVNPSPNYILGPGDKVTVAIWGNSEANFNEEVTASGYLKFQKIPRVYVAGLSLKDVKDALRAKFRRNYTFNNSNFEVTVSATRNVSVFISGDVKNVGSFNISALNTAINALAAAGGPTDIGSVRNIQLRKANGSKSQLDLYKFINDPIISQNFYLEDNDYIVVPLANKIVTIRGAVKRESRYEVLQNETLSDLLDFAGGLKNNALRKNVRIERYENDQLKSLNIDLTDLNAVRSFKLMDGDVVDVSSINEKLRNSVVVSGAIDNEGTFSIEKNLRLSGLLDKVILKDDAILDLAYLLRLNEDKKTSRYQIINVENALNNKGSDSDIILEEGDRLIIRGKSDYTSKYTFEVSGSVRNPNTFDLDGDSEIRVSDALNLAGGVLPSATNFGYIIRKKPGELTPDYLPINILDVIENTTSSENILLSPGDRLEIYEQSEFNDDTYVSIEGAVRNPKRYEYSESLTLKDAILQAGGLTISAASNKIDIFRIEFLNNNKTRVLVANASVDANLNVTSGGELNLKPFDQIVVRTAAEFELQREVSLRGELKYPGKYVLVNDNSNLVDLVKEAGGLTEESFAAGATLFRVQDDVGYIVVNLEEAMSKPNSSTNMILQEGDVLSIPKLNNLVTVTGAINRYDAFSDEVAESGKSNFVFESGKSAKDYIEESGGFAENADKGSTSVTYPNGEVHKTKKILFFKNYPKVVPGSKITVLAKKPETQSEKEKEDIDWGKVLSNSIGQATAILSLILLIQNVD